MNSEKLHRYVLEELALPANSSKVADWCARNVVEDAAWLVAGVRHMDNHVGVR